MSTRTSKTIGKRIRKARVQMGLTQKQLARRLKISDKTVSSYEIGRATPSFVALKKIGKVIHRPISYFDEDTNLKNIDLQIKIKIIEKELLEIKKLLKKRPG